MLRSHIQGVVPVCVPKPVDIMVSNLIESGKLLDKKML